MSDSNSNYVQIDAITCRKRFHCREQIDLPKQPVVEIHCPECHAVVYRKENSHPLMFLRHENLTHLRHLSEDQTTECHFYKSPLR